MKRQSSGRSANILARFPSFMRAEKPGKALGEIAAGLGESLDEAERLLTGIQRAHRLMVADEQTDVLRLAALMGFELADFLILRKLYDNGFFPPVVDQSLGDQEREEKAYREYLSQLKESVARAVLVMREGCGTLWALLEGTAILLNADTVTSPTRIEHPDQDLPRGGFIHRIRIEYSLPGDAKPRRGFIYMLENPVVDKATEDLERRQREEFLATRGGFFPDPVSAQITGVGKRTVLPMLINKATHEGLGYRRALEDGQRLVFATDGKAYLEGAEVTGECYYFKGALAGESPSDNPTPEHVFCVSTPAGALDRNYPRTAPEPAAALPLVTLPLGDSRWRFSVREGAFDAAGFDEAVFAFRKEDLTLPDLPPSGKVQLRWRENEPFAVRILIPAELKSLEQSLLEGQDLRKLVRAGLERFRAAGIRLDVDYFDDKWILDKSILRDWDAESGEGLYFDGTVVSQMPS